MNCRFLGLVLEASPALSVIECKNGGNILMLNSSNWNLSLECPTV